MAIENKLFKNKCFFLSGGAGFIGTKIIERIIEDNEVIVYDTLQRNSLKDTSYANHPNLTIIKGDVLDSEKVKKSMQGSNIIIHLAAIAGIDTVIKSPTKTMNVNYIGTSNMLEAARNLENVERFIDFSTSEVYGSYAYCMGEESCTSMGAVGTARWTYAVSKLAAEHLSHSYHSEFGIPVISLRPFNIFGPGQIGEGAIHNFIKKAILNETIIVHGDGDQIRSWCYIDDMVDGIFLCLENERAVGETFNIGNPRNTITILSLAEKVIEILDSKSNIQHVPKPSVDVELRIPNIENAKNVLNYTPKIDLNEGIRRTGNWYISVMNR
nr:NAD-dependent epimerase/dehydratase family protein [uncultured Methanoregula sp.]